MTQSQDPTRLHVVETLLAEINISTLRPLIRTEKQWRQVCRGFRPDRISKEILLARKLVIARDEQLVLELLESFLKSLGISTESLPGGIQEASEDIRVSTKCRTLMSQLIEADISSIPQGKLESTITKPLPYIKQSSQRRMSPRSGQRGTNLARDEFVWSQPIDESDQTQHVITLFERALVAFVSWRLQKLHTSESWLKQGCGSFLAKWRDRAEGRALEPSSLLGFAELGELKDTMVSRTNWPTFQPYFKTKSFVEQAMSEIIPLRVSGMHPGERDLYLIEHISAVNALVTMASEFHIPTATAIDEVYRQLTGTDDTDTSNWSTNPASTIQTNLSQLDERHIVGRETELKEIHAFWQDPYRRVASIIGAGGVGKTALLDEMVNMLLRAGLDATGRPDPEVVIYLTAKDNYIAGTPTAPQALRFNTLHEIYAATIETIAGELQIDGEMSALRNTVFSFAKEMRILFALDNLESLSDDDMEDVGIFLDDLPPPSKAIITTRDNRRLGKPITLTGLPHDDAIELLMWMFADADIELTKSERRVLDEIVKATGGVPLYLKYAANNVTHGGCTASEALDRLSGRPILDFLEFSYANCFARLPEGAMRVACFLAMSPRPRKRNELAKVCEASDELDDALRRLDQLSFVERVNDSRPTSFRLSSPQLVEYTRQKVRQTLSPAVVTLIQDQLGITTLSSPRNVEIAVDRVIEKTHLQRSWFDRITVLEEARVEWDDHPKILARLGYCYFREHKRRKARTLIQTAIERAESEFGFESPLWYAQLGLIHLIDGHIDDAIRRAQAATTLRPRFHFAEQVLGQALYEKARRGRLTMSQDRVMDMLKEAKLCLVRSLYYDDTKGVRGVHNDRSHRLIGRIESIPGARLTSGTVPW